MGAITRPEPVRWEVHRWAGCNWQDRTPCLSRWWAWTTGRISCTL